MATVRQILSCPKKAWFSSLKLKSDKSIYTFYEDAIVALLEKAKDFSILRNESIVRKTLEDMIPQEMFSMKIEREENLSKATARIVRMGEVMEALDFQYAGVGGYYVYTAGSKSLTGHYSIKAERGGVTYGVTITFNKPSVSTKNGTVSFIGKDIELYVQQMATAEIPAIYSLTGSESWGGEVKEYSMDQHKKSAEGRFFYYFDFRTRDNTDLSQQVEILLAESIGKNAKENKENCANCWYKDLCQMDTSNDVYVEELEDAVSTEGLAPVVQTRNWTKAQDELASIRNGEAKVFAVAGSGKTTSITRLVAELLHDGVDSKNITLCTFTNKGVAEMKSKLQELQYIEPYNTEEYASVLDGNKVHIVSLNGLGYEIISTEAHLRNAEAPKLIDESERLVYIAEIADNYPAIDGLNYANPFFKMFTAEGAIHTLSRYINLLKRTYGDKALDNNDVLSCMVKNPAVSKAILLADGTVDITSVDTIKHIYNDLMDKMELENVITYDDQIFNAVRLLNENEQLLRIFRSKCKYLIVDEFQDTGLEQLRLIEKLYVPSDDSALVVVGDTSQAIMGFRGVGNENVERFTKAYPDAKQIDMDANFRSTREVCDIAENVMKAVGKDVSLKTERHGSPVEFQKGSSRSESCEKAAEQVEEWLSSGVALSDIAVICRTRSELMDVRKHLAEDDIPSTISVAELYSTDGQLIAAYELSKFISSGYSDLKALAIWLRHADKDSFDNAIDVASYIALQGALIKDRYDSLGDPEKHDAFVADVSQTFLNRTTALDAFLSAENGKFASFERLCGDLANIFEMNGSMSAVRDETKYDAVTLTTVHSAKGREWNNVIVCTNGFKAASGLSADDNGNVELKFEPEEARTMFVAVTRAKEDLVVIGNCYWRAALENAKTLTHTELSEDGVKAKAPAKKKK